MADKGPQYTSREFTVFTREWEFKHLTSSPYYSRSNGKSESAVKIVKNLFKKAIADKKDPWLALLDYRNTPTEGIKSSPCQRLMSRRTRTLVPVTTNQLYPEVVDGVQESVQLRRQKAESYFDRNTLPELDIGPDFRVAGQRKKTWQPGKCLERLSDGSYLVQTDTETVRRNREDLRPRLDADHATSMASSVTPEEAKSRAEADTTNLRRLLCQIQV